MTASRSAASRANRTVTSSNQPCALLVGCNVVFVSEEQIGGFGFCEDKFCRLLDIDSLGSEYDLFLFDGIVTVVFVAIVSCHCTADLSFQIPLDFNQR